MERAESVWWLLGLGAVAVVAAVLVAGLRGAEGPGPVMIAQVSADEEAEQEGDAQEEADEAEEEEGEGEKEEEEGTEEKPLVWERPRFEERGEERLRMVEWHMEGGNVKDKAVLEAMRNVPRHLFVPQKQLRFAYRDHPLPIGYGQTISQPSLVAFMTELLQLKPGCKVLEIGTGSGYQAAILSELTPYVFSIEIIKELSEQAGRRFAKLGYKTIEVRHADGYYGWEEHAPFDAIIVTAAAGHIPPPLIKQLKPEGRMVVPVGRPYETQYLVLVKKDEEGRVSTEGVLPVRFVPMTGRVQERE